MKNASGKFSAARLAQLGMLLGAASIVFLIESLVPPLLPAAPYVRLGLANVFLLFVIAVYGAGDAFLFTLGKNLVSMALTGAGFTALFNLAGSLCAYLAMAGLYAAACPRVSPVAVSVAGAVLSNIARTCVAVAVTGAPALFVQLPFVCAFGLAAGILVGVLACFLLKYLPERLTKPK